MKTYVISKAKQVGYNVHVWWENPTADDIATDFHLSLDPAILRGALGATDAAQDHALNHGLVGLSVALDKNGHLEHIWLDTPLEDEIEEWLEATKEWVISPEVRDGLDMLNLAANELRELREAPCERCEQIRNEP